MAAAFPPFPARFTSDVSEKKQRGFDRHFSWDHKSLCSARVPYKEVSAVKRETRPNWSSRELLLSLINKIRILPIIFLALGTHEAFHKPVLQQTHRQRKYTLNKTCTPLESLPITDLTKSQFSPPSPECFQGLVHVVCWLTVKISTS